MLKLIYNKSGGVVQPMYVPRLGWRICTVWPEETPPLVVSYAVPEIPLKADGTLDIPWLYEGTA